MMAVWKALPLISRKALDETLHLRLDLDRYNNNSLTPTPTPTPTPEPPSPSPEPVKQSTENKVEKPKRIADTPLMQQYREMKKKHLDAILLFRVGDLILYATGAAACSTYGPDAGAGEY